jgi:membrane-associated protease RseP (regulator of RpoE activity)
MVLLVGDGLDTCSPKPPADYIRRLRATGVEFPIVVFELAKKADKDAHKQLSDLSSVSNANLFKYSETSTMIASIAEHFGLEATQVPAARNNTCSIGVEVSSAPTFSVPTLLRGRKKLQLPKVKAVQENSPGARAGIQKGDEIFSIDGKSAEHFSAGDVQFLLTGDPGTTVTLSIVRGDKRLSLTCTRD